MANNLSRNGLVTTAGQAPHYANQADKDRAAVIQGLNQRVSMVYQKKSPFYQSGQGIREIPSVLASNVGIRDAESEEVIPRVYSKCKELGMSLSEMLDLVDDSSQYTGAMREMDAFQRMLAVANIRTKPVPEKGIFSDRLIRFFASNIPGSQVLFPEFINREMRKSLIAPDILPYILATTTNVTAGEGYRTIYTDDVESDRRQYRVDQLAELPATNLKTSENVVRVYKYGRVLVGSYEFFERTSIDLFSIMLQRMAMQSNLDKATEAIRVIIAGDLNSNPAENKNQSDLDKITSAHTLPTYIAYLNFALSFYPYQLTTMVGNAASLVNFLTMVKPNVDPLQLLAFLQNGTQPDVSVQLPQPLFQNVQMIYLPDAPDNLLIGLDKRFSLEMIVEGGGNIVETDRVIRSQRNEIAISERVGFGKIFKQASKTWTWNA